MDANALKDLLKRLRRLLAQFGIDPLDFLEVAAEDALRHGMLAGRKQVGSKARRAGYTPKVLADDDEEKRRLVKWTCYSLVREGLPDWIGMDLLTDLIRDAELTAVQAAVLPRVASTLTEKAFLEDLMIPAILAHLPDLSDLVEG